MDFVQRSGVNIPNAVIVIGVNQITESDEQVIDFLKEYGKIQRLLMVDPQSEFYQNRIFEYCSGDALENLDPHLPYTCLATDAIVYEIENTKYTNTM